MHWRYLKAYLALLDQGRPVNYAAIAREMGISRERLWVIRSMTPGLEAWIAERIGAANEHLAAGILRRFGMLGLQGSLQHGVEFLKAMRGLPPGADAAPTVTTHGPTIINLAVPRPGDPPVAAVADRLPGAPT